MLKVPTILVQRGVFVIFITARVEGAAQLLQESWSSLSLPFGRNQWSGLNTLEAGRESSGSQGNAQSLLQYQNHPEFGNSQHSD